MGAGCYKKDGVIYWVQIFAKNPDQKFTLTVDANGGIFPDKGGVEKYTMQVPAGMTLYTDDISKPQKSDNKLNKWTTVYDDGFEISESAYKNVKLHMTENQTLRADWTESN